MINTISYRFLREATIIISYRFLFEATGMSRQRAIEYLYSQNSVIPACRESLWGNAFNTILQ